MRDVKPEQTPKNAKVEHYTNEIDASKDSKFFQWFTSRNWLLWGGITGAIVAIYRNFDRIMGWF